MSFLSTNCKGSNIKNYKFYTLFFKKLLFGQLWVFLLWSPLGVPSMLSFFGNFSKHGSFYILCDSFFLFLSFLSLIANMIENDTQSPPL